MSNAAGGANSGGTSAAVVHAAVGGAAAVGPAVGGAAAVGPAVGVRAGGESLVPSTRGVIYDLSTMDLTKLVLSKDDIGKVSAHRHEMALLEGIVWHSADFKQGVAVWHVRNDEFWVRGHFPDKALLPGVLQVEAGAQLGAFLVGARLPEKRIIAFTHIHECAFRQPVVPGDTYYILCHELKNTGRRFTSQIQGVVGGKLAYDAHISGMVL